MCNNVTAVRKKKLDGKEQNFQIERKYLDVLELEWITFEEKKGKVREISEKNHNANEKSF